MAFDMTKVKVGDKLVRRNGTGVYLTLVKDGAAYRAFPYYLSDDTDVTKYGCFYNDGTKSCLDIVGFAAENQQTNCTFTETQAVELLLSLGYTLKKGSN